MLFPSGTVVKNLPANAGDARDWVGKIPWRRKWQRIPVFLPGKTHGQKRSPVHGIAESDTIEHAQTSHQKHLL